MNECVLMNNFHNCQLYNTSFIITMTSFLFLGKFNSNKVEDIEIIKILYFIEFNINWSYITT